MQVKLSTFSDLRSVLPGLRTQLESRLSGIKEEHLAHVESATRRSAESYVAAYLQAKKERDIGESLRFYSRFTTLSKESLGAGAEGVDISSKIDMARVKSHANEVVEEVHEFFIQKNISKIAPVIAAKEEDFHVEVESVSFGRGGSLESEMTVSFGSGDLFSVWNSVVTVWNARTPHHKFPTTFHDIVHRGASVKTASESWMRHVFGAGLSEEGWEELKRSGQDMDGETYDTTGETLLSKADAREAVKWLKDQERALKKVMTATLKAKVKDGLVPSPEGCQRLQSLWEDVSDTPPVARITAERLGAMRDVGERLRVEVASASLYRPLEDYVTEAEASGAFAGSSLFSMGLERSEARVLIVFKIRGVMALGGEAALRALSTFIGSALLKAADSGPGEFLTAVSGPSLKKLYYGKGRSPTKDLVKALTEMVWPKIRSELEALSLEGIKLQATRLLRTRLEKNTGDKVYSDAEIESAIDRAFDETAAPLKSALEDSDAVRAILTFFDSRYPGDVGKRLIDSRDDTVHVGEVGDKFAHVLAEETSYLASSLIRGTEY